MSANDRVDLFDSTYGNFEAEVMRRVRQRTFGEDFGQNSWTTADEYRRWADRLQLDVNSHVLEVASGSGGPALFLCEITECSLIGVDINDLGVLNANLTSKSRGMNGRARFQQVDAEQPLPFEDESFDAVICIDSANHFVDRLRVLQDWFRVLKVGGKLLWTDPVVVTGLVTNEEIASRSSIGVFVFGPSGLNEALIGRAGFKIETVEDATENAAIVSKNWMDARDAEREPLLTLEGQERFEGLQRFFRSVHELTASRRLSRIAYHCIKEV